VSEWHDGLSSRFEGGVPSESSRSTEKRTKGVCDNIPNSLLWLTTTNRCSRSEAVREVLDILDRALSNRETRELNVEDGIAGRFLAESITAPRDVPAHDHATMDGFAVDATESYPLTVSDGEIFPEDEPPSLKRPEKPSASPLARRSQSERMPCLAIEEASVEAGKLRGQSRAGYVYVRTGKQRLGW